MLVALCAAVACSGDNGSGEHALSGAGGMGTAGQAGSSGGGAGVAGVAVSGGIGGDVAAGSGGGAGLDAGEHPDRDASIAEPDAAATDGGDAGELSPSYYLGADITFQESQPEATRAELLALMKQHGFNAIRLRTFVDPRAADGYDKVDGYGDIANTAAFGKQIKAAGMALLIDFHYSDNWADPGKQCVPIAWQGLTTIGALASALHDYTKDAITQLIAAGARPDMVQIGNETTPGMLLHRCDSDGQPTGSNPVAGSTSNWDDLGALLKAGVDAVREVDPSILTSFHIDRGGDKPADDEGAALELSTWWIENALEHTSFDAFGESCYQRYQGDPDSIPNSVASWQLTLGGLAAGFPQLRIYCAEYGPAQREVNDVVYGLPNEQGLGTFNWEPATQGAWNTGHDLIRRSGDAYVEQPDLALYDAMKADYAERL